MGPNDVKMPPWYRAAVPAVGLLCLWPALPGAGPAHAQAPEEAPPPAPAPETGTETETETESESETETESESGSESESESGSESETGSETGSESGSGSGPESESGSDSDNDSEAAPAQGETPPSEAGWGEGDEAGWDADDEAGWGGDDTAGFEAIEDTTPPPPPPVNLTVSGFLRTREALWVERFDANPFAKARQSVDLSLRYKKRMGEVLLRLRGDVHVEYDLAYLHDRDSYDDATLDVYESRIIGGESFGALSYDVLELTFGRQIVAWGQGEMLSPLDVVNPRDMREPGLGELDDVRLAVLASRAGLFFDELRFEAMVIHESDFGLLPAPLSDFSPLRALILQDPMVATLLSGRDLRFAHEPARWDEPAGQLLGRVTYKGPGADLGLYAASVRDRQGTPRLPDPADLASESLRLTLVHPRYFMLGQAGAVPAGDFVLRWEAGVDLRRPLTVTDASQPGFNLETRRATQLNWLLGLTFAGIDDASVGLEYAQSLLPDDPADDPDRPGLELLAPVEQPAFAARYTHNFLRETLRLTAVVTVFGVTEYRGFFARAEISYELRDALKLGLGYATYQPHGDFGPLFGFDDHDRVFTSLRWDFVLD